MVSTSKTDKPYHHGDLRTKLIQVGVEILQESGPSALSLRELARRAGVSHAAPYRHFPDHQALLAAIAAEGFDLLGAWIAKASANEPTPRAALRAALHAYLGFGRLHPHYLQLMFGIDLSGANASLKAIAEDAFTMLTGMVAAAEQECDPMEARRLALALWAEVHGLVQLSMVLQLQNLADGEDSMAAAEAALDTLIARFLPTNGKQPHA